MPNFPLYVWILLVAYGMLAVPYIEWAGGLMDKLAAESDEAEKLQKRGEIEEYKRRVALLRLTMPTWIFLLVSLSAFVFAYLLVMCAKGALRLLGTDLKTFKSEAPEMYWLCSPLLPFASPFLLVIALIIRIFHSPKPKKVDRQPVSAS